MTPTTNLAEQAKASSSMSALVSPTDDFLCVVKSDIELQLITKTEAVVESLGLQLRDLEVLGAGAGTIVRVTLDKKTEVKTESATVEVSESITASTSDTIGIEDCSKVHRLLSPMFDVWDPLPHAYSLEVASPGEKPTLRLYSHFLQAVGQKIHFQTTEALPMPEPMKPRRNWEGILKSIDPSAKEILLQDGYGEHRVALTKVKTATLLREWGAKQDPPGKSHQKKKAKEKNL